MAAELGANLVAKEGVGARLGAVWGAFGYESQRLLGPVFGGAFAPGTVPFCGFRVVSVFPAKNWRMENESVLFCK
jgi:hypothetical protein